MVSYSHACPTCGVEIVYDEQGKLVSFPGCRPASSPEARAHRKALRDRAMLERLEVPVHAT